MKDGFADAQDAATQSLDILMESLSAWSRGAQTMALEGADFSRKAFGDSVAHVQSLLGMDSLEHVAEAHGDFIRTSIERSAGQASRFGELFTELAKDVAKPFEEILPVAR